MTDAEAERAAYLALMYQDDEEIPETQDPTKPQSAEARPHGILSLPALSHMIRAQAKTIEAQGRLIQRLEQRMRVLDRQIGQQGRAINDVDAEMGQKIDRRDWDR